MLKHAATATSRPGLSRFGFSRGSKLSKTTVRVFAAMAPAVQATALSPEAKVRARAAILGGLVADAASMPLHWIYDVPKINELLKAEGRTAANPEFYPTPSCSFYQAPFGDLSPYGAELVPLLKTIADNGDLDATKFSEAIHHHFTTTSAYRNASIRKVIENFEAGKRGTDCGHETDFQANCFAKASILVAKYGGQPQLYEKAELAIRVQQNNDQAVKYGLAGVRLLEKVVVEGLSLDGALEWALTPEGGAALGADIQALVARGVATKKAPLRDLQFEPAEYMKEMMNKHLAIKDELPPFTWAVWCNGPACGNPAAFANVAMTAADYTSYVDGVRANLLAGGDNCSRSCLIGALLAAADKGGSEVIPQEWRQKTTGFSEYEALVDKLLA